MKRRGCILPLVGIPVICLLCLGAYFLPPVRSRLGPRLESWAADLRRSLVPEGQVVFVPQDPGDPLGESTLQALLQPTLALDTPLPTQGAAATPTPTLAPDIPTVTPLPSATPTRPPTPIPERVVLEGVRYENQSFNNCGPANLSMALSFWGWPGDQRDTRLYLRPNLEVDDKNIMPEEMVRFVETQTGLKALTRVGGDVDLLKQLIAAGFPVVIEKGHHPADDWWMGHFMVINGYNDSKSRFLAQDSLAQPDTLLPYDEVIPWWRNFNFVYIVIYPPDREEEVYRILGQRLDAAYGNEQAAQRAREEIASLEGRDLYFAWFNLGSSLVALGDYTGAAGAYDQAFAINAGLPDQQRLYRMLWYQIGPYAAYYHAGRYQDVIDLGNATFSWLGKTDLEETLYWMGLARQAMGDVDKAIQNFTRAATLNPNYDPPRQALAQLGVAAP